MSRTVADLSPAEFETLIERAVDRRLAVWMTQLADAFFATDDGDDLSTQFAESLRNSISQAERGELSDLETFRSELGV